jgi:hypothetical protein
VIVASGRTLGITVVSGDSRGRGEEAPTGGTAEEEWGELVPRPGHPARTTVDTIRISAERTRVRASLFGSGERTHTIEAPRILKFGMINFVVAGAP